MARSADLCPLNFLRAIASPNPAKTALRCWTPESFPTGNRMSLASLIASLYRWCQTSSVLQLCHPVQRMASCFPERWYPAKNWEDLTGSRGDIEFEVPSHSSPVRTELTGYRARSAPTSVPPLRC